MKNNVKLKAVAIIALISVTGLVITSCVSSGGSTKDYDPLTSYTITFNDNGSTGGRLPAKITGGIGETVTIPGNGTLIKKYYAFTGWNTKASGYGDKYMEGDIYDKNMNITLYAQWKQVARPPDKGRPNRPSL